MTKEQLSSRRTAGHLFICLRNVSLDINKADKMPCARLAIELKQGDAMVFLALPFFLSDIRDVFFQLTPFTQSHDKTAGSSSVNSSSSNRDGEIYFVYNRLSARLFQATFGCIFLFKFATFFES